MEINFPLESTASADLRWFHRLYTGRDSKLDNIGTMQTGQAFSLAISNNGRKVKLDEVEYAISTIVYDSLMKNSKPYNQ